MFDPSLAFVSRVIKHVAVVGRREMRREECDRRERHRAVAKQIQDNRKSARGARGFDPSVGGVLREMEHLCAIGEQRRAALAEIQTPDVDLDEQGDQPRCRFTLAVGGDLDLREEVRVRQLRDGGE